jgi:hypothetical protein
MSQHTTLQNLLAEMTDLFSRPSGYRPGYTARSLYRLAERFHGYSEALWRDGLTQESHDLRDHGYDCEQRAADIMDGTY